MAGGLGKRMLPFTSILPKPLLPLKDQTVIEKLYKILWSKNLGRSGYRSIINLKL